MKVINEKKGEPERLIQVIPAGGSESGDWSWTAGLGERLEGAEREFRFSSCWLHIYLKSVSTVRCLGAGDAWGAIRATDAANRNRLQVRSKCGQGEERR